MQMLLAQLCQIQHFIASIGLGSSVNPFEVFSQYTFHIAVVGTVILAIGCSLIGTFNVLKGQALIGDAVGHASYPGIIIAFILVMSRNTLLLTVGASVAGLVAYALIQQIVHHSRLGSDAAMAIILSSFFGLGSMLNAYVTTSDKFARVAQAGLQNYVFGQAADMLYSDLYLIGGATVLSLILLFLYIKEVKLSVFDPTFAQTAGFRPRLLNTLLLVMAMLLISQGLKTIGVILISSLFICPYIAASQWTCKLNVSLLLSAIFAACSAFLGTWLSSLYNGVSTGPAIICILSSVALISILIGPRGMLATKHRQRRQLKSELTESRMREERA
ncbi:MAG: metal ABC transporter permease [Eubacteriales bacterium]|nr:metal ABC transporter permease [Eubacteriales bacterium]